MNSKAKLENINLFHVHLYTKENKLDAFYKLYSEEFLFTSTQFMYFAFQTIDFVEGGKQICSFITM